MYSKSQLKARCKYKPHLRLVRINYKSEKSLYFADFTCETKLEKIEFAAIGKTITLCCEAVNFSQQVS
jgi:hypothetical protein